MLIVIWIVKLEKLDGENDERIRISVVKLSGIEKFTFRVANIVHPVASTIIALVARSPLKRLRKFPAAGAGKAALSAEAAALEPDIPMWFHRSLHPDKNQFKPLIFLWRNKK